MSLIARCPACQTTFRVVQDQLRVSDGWVRCGRCTEIFDARLGLLDEVDAGQTAVSPAVSLVAPVVVPAAAFVAPPNATPAVAPVSATTEVYVPKPFVAHDETRVEAHVEAPVETKREPMLADLVTNTAVEVLPKNAEFRLSAQPQTREPVLGPDTVPPAHDLSFLRPMPNPKSAMNVWVKAVLGMLVLLSLALLALQAGLHERARLAAMFPQSKPALQWVCQYLGCTVSALKQIESVVIDGSSFNKVRGDNYRLSLTIRNAAVQDIAMPALELSLTDSQDQVLMRKIILPQEIVPNNGFLAGGSEWTGQIAMQVRPAVVAGSSEAAERFSGYRVLAFYP